MNTIFTVERHMSDLKADLKKGRLQYCPCNFESIQAFKRWIREAKASHPQTTLGYKVEDEQVVLDIGDTVVLEEIYYRVVKKTYEFRQNRIVYTLDIL